MESRTSSAPRKRSCTACARRAAERARSESRSPAAASIRAGARSFAAPLRRFLDRLQIVERQLAFFDQVSDGRLRTADQIEQFVDEPPVHRLARDGRLEIQR